jgi:hypothetical protein
MFPSYPGHVLPSPYPVRHGVFIDNATVDRLIHLWRNRSEQELGEELLKLKS